MKKLFILSVLFVMISCNETTFDTNTYHAYHDAKNTNDVYKVVIYTNSDPLGLNVVIDSCEYLIGRDYAGYYGFGYLTHKGNCKYCAERRKRELQNLK